MPNKILEILAATMGYPPPVDPEPMQMPHLDFGVVPQMARIGLEFVPGAGEYLDFGETLQSGRQAEQKIMQGDLLGALAD
jgi:hypothetical protein